MLLGMGLNMGSSGHAIGNSRHLHRLCFYEMRVEGGQISKRGRVAMQQRRASTNLNVSPFTEP